MEEKVCQKILSQGIFTKKVFSSENQNIYGYMAVQAKQGLSQLDKKIIGTLLIALIAIVSTVSLLFPIESTKPNSSCRG
jgi:hypothetical protein